MATQAKSLSSLLARTTIEDHEDVLKSSNQEIKKNKDDLTAQHAKVVALLKLDRYQEAQHAYESFGDGLKEKAKLEWAYTLWKIGRLDEAVQVAGTSDTRAGKHVQAQALYRREDFSSAAKIYRDLAKDRLSEEEHDLRINSSATNAQLTWQGKSDEVGNNKPSRQDLEAFETAYNAAAGSIARGEYAQADVLLKRARELCRHSEHLPDEEKAAELLNISVQQLYTLEKLEKYNDAESLAAQIEPEEISDISTQKIAHNNLLCLPSRSSNPFSLYKDFRSSPETSGNDTLFSFQSSVHENNSYVVDLRASKYDGVARSTSKAIKLNSGSPTSPAVVGLSVLHAAAESRGAAGKAAIKALASELAIRSTDVGLVLLLVQLYMRANNPSSAIGVLEAFLEHIEKSGSEEDKHTRYSPGLVGILVMLYKTQGRKSRVAEELHKAASYWRRTSESPSKSLLLAAGKILLESGQSAQELDSAKEIFETLHKSHPADPQVSVGYIASHALSSSGAAKIPVENLPSVSDIIAGVDVDALEESGVAKPPYLAARKVSIANALGPTRKRPSAETGRPGKKRRLPKSRIPQDYVEGKQMDPDRWLPLRERASYRPKKGKKGKERDRGTQGGVVKEDAAATKVEPNGGGGGGGAKSKKKGKRK